METLDNFQARIRKSLNTYCFAIDVSVSNQKEFYLDSDVFNQLLIQTKELNGIKHLALKNIDISLEYRGYGYFKMLIHEMLHFCISHKIPFLVHDIINNHVEKHLNSIMGLEYICYYSHDNRKIDCFKLKDEFIY